MLLPVARINLLPYRDRRVKELRVHFFSITAVVIVLAVITVIAVDVFLGTFVTAQDARVDEINRKIAAEDKEIAEIAKLKKDIDVLIGRKSVIENLQDEKNNPLCFFNALTTAVGQSGLYITGLTQSGDAVTITAVTDSNGRISQFISNLENSKGVFSQVSLGQSQQFKLGSQTYFNFNLVLKSNIGSKKACQ